MTIPEIFEKFGEPYFRDGERKVIARLLDSGPMVLATGGGAFMNAATRERIAASGVSIWLNPTFEVLLRRVRKRSNRPLLQTADPEGDAASPAGGAQPDLRARRSHHRIARGSARGGGRADPRRARPQRARPRPAERTRMVAGDLGARAYEIVIGEGLIASAGERIEALFPTRAPPSSPTRTSRRIGSTPLARQPRGRRDRGGDDRLPARRDDQILRRIRARQRRADRRADRAARRRDRARRRRHRRSRRLRRGDAAARRRLCADPDQAAGAGRFQRRRQDGDQFAARQEPDRRLPPALAWFSPTPARSHTLPRARVPRRLRRGRQIRLDRRPRLLRMAGSATGARCSPAARRGRRRSRRVAPPRRASSPPTRPSRARARCSTSATPSATRWRRSPITIRAILVHGEGVAVGLACAFRFSRALGALLGPGRRRGSSSICKAVGLPTRIQDIAGLSADARGDAGGDAAGQEGRARQADLHPGARHRRELHRQGRERGATRWRFCRRNCLNSVQAEVRREWPRRTRRCAAAPRCGS